MAKINLSKVIGISEDEANFLLPGSNTSKSPRWGSWQTRIPAPLRSSKFLWSFAILIIVLQTLVLWRLFFYRESGPKGPPYNTTETVALITEYYKLLQDMHYLSRNSIAYPPHVGAKAINVTLARYLGLDDRLVDTLNQLPYVIPEKERLGLAEEDGWLTNWSKWTNTDRDIFWQSAKFVDYRNDTNLWLSRDPKMRWRTDVPMNTPFEVAMVELEAIPKTAIPLSVVGLQNRQNYGVPLILDTASNRIVMLETQGSHNSDEFFDRFDWDKIPKKYHLPKTKFYGSSVRGARSAPDVLRELIQKTATLDSGYVPGAVRSDKQYTPELSPPKWEQWIKKLYSKHNWPRKDILGCLYPSIQRESVKSCDQDPLATFDGDAFDAEMKSLLHDVTVRYMPDWYCPVPRNASFIERLKTYNKLTEEQIDYAESDEPVIPLNLDGWGAHLLWIP